MTFLKLTSFWLKNFFNFTVPNFSQLDYTNYIIEGKSYLVFSWQLKNAYQLKIKSAGFKSFLKYGSAYTALSAGNRQLEVVISNLWRSRKYQLKLNPIVIDDTIEFPATMLTDFTTQINIVMPQPKFSNLKAHPFNTQVINKKQIKTIINISYPN